MIISCIVAKSSNNVIGFENDIPWYLPADLKHFKKITTGHHILMGRKCYKSIGRPLPNRTNMIVTRDPFFVSTGCIVCHSIEEGLEQAHQNGESEVFVIGGGEIYRQTMGLWDKLYLTEVNLKVKGDVFFPEIDMGEWKEISRQEFQRDEKNNFAYSYIEFIKKPID